MVPATCPVCRGNGLVPNGFYRQTSGDWSSTSVTPEICRSCGGTGVVWSSETSNISGEFPSVIFHFGLSYANTPASPA